MISVKSTSSTHKSSNDKDTSIFLGISSGRNISRIVPQLGYKHNNTNKTETHKRNEVFRKTDDAAASEAAKDSNELSLNNHLPPRKKREKGSGRMAGKKSSRNFHFWLFVHPFSERIYCCFLLSFESDEMFFN